MLLVIAAAQRTPRAGPSNVARKPSPRLFTSWPRNRLICVRTASSWRSSSARHCRSPSSAARFVEIDDVGEQHRRQHAIGLGFAARACQKLLGFADDAVDQVGFPERVVINAGQFDELRSGDMVGDVASRLDRDAGVAGAMQDQVGTRIVGSMWRASTSPLIRRQAIAAAGLALCRS